jgi:hypothetical protein
VKIAKGTIAVAKPDFGTSRCSAAIVSIKRQLRVKFTPRWVQQRALARSGRQQE